MILKGFEQFQNENVTKQVWLNQLNFIDLELRLSLVIFVTLYICIVVIFNAIFTNVVVDLWKVILN